MSNNIAVYYPDQWSIYGIPAEGVLILSYHGDAPPVTVSAEWHDGVRVFVAPDGQKYTGTTLPLSQFEDMQNNLAQEEVTE